MTDNAAKRKIVYAVTAAIIAVALILSCVLTAFFYTRTGGVGTGNIADGGENADENKLLNSQYSYGERLPGDVAPSGSFVMNIASATDLTNFLNSTTYTYGILTQDISLSSSNMSNTSGEVKPSTDRILAEGKTLDGNGHTITTYFYESATLECREVSGGLTSDWYKSYFTFQQNGTNTAVDIGNGVSAFGLSNVVSVNRGTIKNLKVSVSASSGRESVAKAVVTAPEGYDGNIGMGVVAGINFGTVENCASTVNIPYGFYGSPVQANSRNAGDSGNKILSRQGIVAVGGIVGINKGTVLNTEVNQNSDIGTYRSVYTVSYYYWVNRVTGDIYNDNIGSGIVGGVAGLNDGGVINGVSYNAAAGSLSNKNNHTAISYTGMIVGLANLQNAKGGAAVSYNAGYYANGAIQSGGTISVAAGSVQNIKYSLYSGFGAACEAYAFTGSRGGFMENGDGWTAVGTYVGLVGGRVTTNGTVATKIVTGGVTFDSTKYSFRAWNATELNGSLAFTDNSMPLFGYGSGGTVTSDHYQNLYVAARLEGQNTEASLSGDFGNDSVFLSLAQVGYLWNSYVGSDGTVVSRVLYTVNFDNMPDLAGRNYSVYKQNGSVQGVDGSVTVGSDDYNASSLTDGGRIEWNADHAPQWTLMLYSLRIDDFSDINAFNAFVSADKRTNNEHFAYAYANAVKLTQTNTLSSPSLTGDKVMKSWKTLDGNGQTLILNDTATNVSGSSVQVSVGGQTIVGISDFISVNYGTVKDLNLYYGTSSRTADGTVASLNSFAYGRVAGVNFGTLQNVNVNNDGTVGDGSPTNVTTTQPFGVVGLAVGVNAGTIDTLHTIVWQNLSANASSFAAAGGAVGMNDGGTLKNVIVDGVASASVRAAASGGESFVGGILGAGSNYGSWTSGTVTVSAPSGAASSPFEDWTFVGKQILRTEGSNVGMLAGRIAADPTLAGNGGQAIREMVVMMPQTNSAIGWFTSETGRMSLLGKTTGVAAQSGYIATDLVVGYYAYIDDASTSYISKIYTDYNIAKGDSGVTAFFTTGVYNGSSAVRSVSSISVQTENMSAPAAALISFGANLSSATQSVFVPVQVAATDSVFVSEGNDGNYAPSVKLYYDYDVNLSQTESDADTSMAKSSLEAFVSGDASSATGAGTHKIIAAGASGATLTSDMSLSITIVADFVKTRGLDGGGRTVTFNPSAAGGVNYDRDGETLVAVGVLASVNRTSVTNVNVAFGGSLSTNIGASYAFGGIVGVNLGTVAGTVSYNGKSVSLSGNSAYSYVGGAVGVNRGVANGVRVSYDGGSLYADNGSGTRTALGGVIGLQDSTLLSDVQVTGNGGSLSVGGNAVVGGVIGLANVSAGDSVAGVKASKTALTNIANAAYGMTLSALSGYTGLITGILSDGAVEGGSLSGIAAHYPDNISDYKLPWRTTATNTLSMYGSGTATALDGILFKVSDHSNDGGAEYLTARTISVNGAARSFTFDVSQIASLSSVSFDAKYCYYDTDGALATDDSYTGAPSQSGTVCTTTVSGTYANSASYVPTLDVLIDYTVNIGNGENQQLVDFMRGASSSGYDSYAGAIRANLMSGAKFTLDGSTASQRGETSSKGKKLVGSAGNVINVSGVLPTAEYDGNTVVGGFFAVNRVEISDLTVSSSANLSPSGYAFGLLAGVNESSISGVSATLAASVSANASAIGALTGVNNGVLDDVAVNLNGLNASYGEKISFGAVAGVNTAKISSATATLSGAYTFNADKIYYGGAVGSNDGTLENVTVTVGTAIAGSDYLSRLSSAPEQRTISLGANDLAIWGGVLGYNAGSVTGATLLANVNYGMSAGAGHVSAGGVVGMNDGGALAGVKATGWGGFYVLSSNIMASSSKSVFVGGLVGSMNADGASKIGFIEFANAVPATLTDSVFALSGGMVTMNSYSVGMTRYGYVTGVLAAVYGNIPEGAVTNTFWFIPDKLKSVEGDDAEVLPAFHGGNATYPTYISVFGTAPTDWLSDGMTANAAEFAVNSYGFALVDSDDNPINYLTMDAMITSGVLTLTVHKPSGNMFITTPDFDHTVTGSGGTGAGSVGAGGGQDQTLTVSNVGKKGVGYVTFSFESGVYALTDSAYAEFTQYMILSFLSTKPFGTVKGSGSNDYYTYSTVDGEISRSIGDSVYRVYQVWSGATEMRIQGSNHTVTISAVPSQPLVLGKGKIFNGGQDSGNKISVVSSFENNIAEYSFGDGQNYLVVSEFLAINYGTLTNANVSITGTDGGHDIYRSANDVLANAANAGIDLSGTALKGFIYGMLVGVNEGEVSQLGGYSFDRTIELDSDAGSRYNSIFGGMVGAQSGADALIKDIGDITFGTQERAGGITMSGAANLVAAGGVVGIAIEGTISNFTVNLTSESFLSVTANHNTAAVGGVVGDLRANLTDVTFESEYRSEMKISNTNASGVATLANLVGVVNSFNGTTASIERVKVIGVGYLYNGIDENGTVTTSSINLYTAGVVGMGANYGNVDAESVAAMPEGERKNRAQQVVAAYGEIIPAKLDSVYVDFEGYVRAKANTNVGMIAARLLNGVTEEARNVDISLISNLVWQTKLEGDSLWTTNVNYADYSSAMNTNSAVAVLGYAPATIDSNTPDLRGVGMRIWLTNNLYAVNSSVADMVITWTSGGNLNASVIGDIGWQNLVVSSVYYDKSGAELSERFKTIKSYGTYGSATQTTVAVDVEEALSEIKNSSAVFPDGIYMLRLTFNEVYIYNAKQLMTFMSSGADTTQGLLSSDADYNSYANANVGIIANDLEVNYATQGTGDRAGEHYYTTAVTMRADKILEGNGNNVTITTSGNIHSAVIDDKGNTPAGALLSGEYYWDYIGGMNTLSSADLNQMDTQYSIGFSSEETWVPYRT